MNWRAGRRRTRVVQEDQLLDERHRARRDLPGLGAQGVLEQGGEVLGFAAGEQQRGILGAVAVAHPMRSLPVRMPR